MGFTDFPMCLSETDSHPISITIHKAIEFPNSKKMFDQIQQSKQAPSNYASQIPEFDVKNRAQMNQDQDQEQKGVNNSGSFVFSFKGLDDSPAAGEIQQEEEDDGCKTPTRMEFKIPPQICPPAAPRKPMAIFANAAAKRSRRRRLLLDYSSEIESLFPPEIVADFGNKIKKVKNESIII